MQYEDWQELTTEEQRQLITLSLRGRTLAAQDLNLILRQTITSPLRGRALSLHGRYDDLTAEAIDRIFRQAAEAMMGGLKEFHEDFDEWRKGFYASIRTWIDDNRELTTRQFDTIREMYKDYCDPNAAVTRRTHS
jgi:hypothetical protein